MISTSSMFTSHISSAHEFPIMMNFALSGFHITMPGDSYGAIFTMSPSNSFFPQPTIIPVYWPTVFRSTSTMRRSSLVLPNGLINPSISAP